MIATYPVHLEKVLYCIELEIKVNGELSANGQDSNARGGGGSGGSISIHTSEFDGTGDIIMVIYLNHPISTLGRRQSKTLILSTKVDKNR